MAEKILIVDDDIDSLKLIGLMLQRQGYEVQAASAGSQALAKAEAERPDLIILDVMMPDMNGLEVCRRLRANPKTTKIPIIMFTAKTLIDDKVKGFEAGADDYLTKPTHPAELASRIKAILVRSAAKQEAQQPKHRGHAIGVMGAKGGVGTTTVAINLAAALMQAGDNPIIADLRLGVGSLGLSLNMGRAQGMARILSKPVAEINAKNVLAEMNTHQSGLRALVSSSRPREAQIQFPVENMLALMTVLRSMSRPTIIDLGHTLDAVTLRAQAEMEKIIMVVEPNGMTISMAREILNEIENEGGAGRISVVVVNRSQSSLQTPWHEVETALGRDVKSIISAAPELAFQALENAIPMVLLQPSSIVAGQFVKLAEETRIRIKSPAGGQPTT